MCAQYKTSYFSSAKWSVFLGLHLEEHFLKNGGKKKVLQNTTGVKTRIFHEVSQLVNKNLQSLDIKYVLFVCFQTQWAENNFVLTSFVGVL